MSNDSFEVTEQKAKAVWSKTLSRLVVEGDSVDQIRTFYSCLYRMLFFPNKLYEINAEIKIVHWSPYTGNIEEGYMFAGTGFWDTFRALYPFLNLVYPSINKEIQAGLINAYKEGGWLPEWFSPGYSDSMIGNNSASVVSDAYIKGLRSCSACLNFVRFLLDASFITYENMKFQCSFYRYKIQTQNL